VRRDSAVNQLYPKRRYRMHMKEPKLNDAVAFYHSLSRLAYAYMDAETLSLSYDAKVNGRWVRYTNHR
jgi:hypothetical protein